MNKIALVLGAALLGSGLLAALAAAPRAATAEEEKPYEIRDGKVSREVFNGYRRYANSCMQCHGPDGAGSSYAPVLTESLKHMNREAFNDVIVNGRRNVTTSQQNVMPAFGEVEDVVLYLDDIYGYLKARSDGALGRGRPQRLGE